MLLPNVHSLGYKAGQAVSSIISSQRLPELPPMVDIWDFLCNIPSLYKEWWLNLVLSDPIHVCVETMLIISVLVMIVRKNKDWRNDDKERLSEAEKEDLLVQWRERERESLVPPPDDMDELPNVIVHSLQGRTMEIQQGDDGEIHSVLNFATFDFLGMSCSSGPGAAVKEASRETLGRYGCGSCGPRGFYGTIDVHLDLESAISKFTHTEGAIMYSDGASTVSSTVAAFAKRGDLLVVDEGVYEPLVTGIALSRANVKWFRHNDMKDLRRVLDEVKATDRRLGRKTNDQRRFIVVEGLYKNSGTIVPFDELAALKHEYSYRLIVDESFSFGTLGETGRGVVESCGKRYMYDAEIVTISLENSLGSIGGVTVGNEEVVDHQRLSGAGYCFSASSPPFTASAAIQALAQLENRPEILQRLNKNKEYMYTQLTESMNGIIPEIMIVTSDRRSPIVLLELSEGADEFLDDSDFPDDTAVLDAIVQDCLENGVALVSTGSHVHENMHSIPPPAIRLTVSTVHTQADIDQCVKTVTQAVNRVLGR